MESGDTISCTLSKKRRMDDSEATEKDTMPITASFEALNSALLTKIFSNLNQIKDLAALGSTCKKFNRIARKVFAAKHQTELIEIRENVPLKTLVTMLRCFQNQFTRLAIFYSNKPKINVKIDVLVNKYCQKMLTELQFSDVGLYSSGCSFVFPFRNVMKLIIRSGILSGKLGEIAKTFPNVMSIILSDDVTAGGEKDNATIPTLQHLSFYFINYDRDEFKTTLLKSNPQLTSLNIDYIDIVSMEHLILIRDSLPNLQRLSLGDVSAVHLDKEPFKPLLFKNLRFLSISYRVSSVLRNFVITSSFPIERIDLTAADGVIDSNCINFLRRHQAKHVHLTLSKMNNQHIEQLVPVLSTALHVNFVILKEVSVTRNGLMNFVTKCKGLEYVCIQQPNITSLPPIVVSMQSINESLWNKD